MCTDLLDRAKRGKDERKEKKERGVVRKKRMMDGRRSLSGSVLKMA